MALSDTDLLQSLNSIDITTHLPSFSFLPRPASNNNGGNGFDSRLFTRRLFLLLSWATCPNQAGDYRVRPSAAATLIFLWKAEAQSFLPQINQILQRNLLAWLDENGFLQPRQTSSYCADNKASNLRTVEATSLLFGELTHRRLFGFNDYLNRMTSFGRGSTAKSETPFTSTGSNAPTPYEVEAGPTHLELLRCIPLWDKISEQALNQRKIVLYGIRAKKTVEDVVEKEVRAEIRRILPIFFNGTSCPSTVSFSIYSLAFSVFSYKFIYLGPPTDEPLTRELMARTLGATKFVQARVLHHWLLDLVKDYVNRYVQYFNRKRRNFRSQTCYLQDRNFRHCSR